MSEKVRRYQEAMEALDVDALGTLRHPDYVCIYPQSGERLVGHENWALAHKDYESHFGEVVTEATVKGGKRRATATTTTSPQFFLTTPIVQVSDTGDLVTLEGSGRWPDGKTYNWVQILEYRNGLVWRETQYFAEPFEAPEWRAPFVEQSA